MVYRGDKKGTNPSCGAADPTNLRARVHKLGNERRIDSEKLLTQSNLAPFQLFIIITVYTTKIRYIYIERESKFKNITCLPKVNANTA